jgi:hypothetical protein
MILVSIPDVSAYGFTDAYDYGTFDKGDCINLVQTCANCSYSNITILNPDSTVAVSNVGMTSDGTYYSYNFCSTTSIGLYTVTGVGDENGITSIWNYNFNVGIFVNSFNFYILILIVLIGVVILGFSIKEVWFVVLGGLGFMMLGLYSFNYGIVGFKDMFMVYGIALFEIAVGAILSIGAGMQKIEMD